MRSKIECANSSALPAKDWIGIFAHPDDEWVAGWPVFQDATAHRGVIYFVGDNRSARDGSTSWEPALRSVLDSLGIEFLGCLNLPPDFYGLRRSQHRLLCEHLSDVLGRTATGKFCNASILTHNSVGEYGHPDHKTVFQTVVQASPSLDVYITDLCYEGELSSMERRLYYSQPTPDRYELQVDRWETAVDLYRMNFRWTGRSTPSTTSARLYKL